MYLMDGQASSADDRLPPAGGLKSATFIITGEYLVCCSAEAGFTGWCNLTVRPGRPATRSPRYVWPNCPDIDIRSRKRTSASTRIDRAAPEDNTSTSPTRRASRTFPRHRRIVPNDDRSTGTVTRR
jgi:hypothetical protein